MTGMLNMVKLWVWSICCTFFPIVSMRIKEQCDFLRVGSVRASWDQLGLSTMQLPTIGVLWISSHRRIYGGARIPFLRIHGTPNIIILVNPLKGIRWKVVSKNLPITPWYFRTRSCGGCPAKMSKKLLVRPVLHLPVRRVRGGSRTLLA
jgi:hypothetical protein